MRSRTSVSRRAWASAMCRTSTVRAMQPSSASRRSRTKPAAVSSSSSRLPSRTQWSPARRSASTSGGDPGNMGQPPAPLEVQDVGAALQFGCDPAWRLRHRGLPLSVRSSRSAGWPRTRTRGANQVGCSGCLLHGVAGVERIAGATCLRYARLSFRLKARGDSSVGIDPGRLRSTARNKRGVDAAAGPLPKSAARQFRLQLRRSFMKIRQRIAVGDSGVCRRCWACWRCQTSLKPNPGRPRS